MRGRPMTRGRGRIVNYVPGPAQDPGRLVPTLGWHKDQVGVVGRGDEDRQGSLSKRAHHGRQHAGQVETVRALPTVESGPAAAGGLVRADMPPHDSQPLRRPHQGDPVRA